MYRKGQTNKGGTKEKTVQQREKVQTGKQGLSPFTWRHLISPSVSAVMEEQTSCAMWLTKGPVTIKQDVCVNALSPAGTAGNLFREIKVMLSRTWCGSSDLQTQTHTPLIAVATATHWTVTSLCNDELLFCHNTVLWNQYRCVCCG